MIIRFPLRFRRCKHEFIRCIHGDEIIALNYKRGECVMCGRLFKELPRVCAHTGKVHGA